jgi:hypothetical protein
MEKTIYIDKSKLDKDEQKILEVFSVPSDGYNLYLKDPVE